MHIVNLKEQKNVYVGLEAILPRFGAISTSAQYDEQRKQSKTSSLSPYSEYFFYANTYLLVP